MFMLLIALGHAAELPMPSADPATPAEAPVPPVQTDVLALQATGLTLSGLGLGAHIYAYAVDQSRVNGFILPHVGTVGNILTASGTMLDAHRLHGAGLQPNRWLGEAALSTTVIGHAPLTVSSAIGGGWQPTLAISVGTQALAYGFNILGVVDNARIRNGGRPLLGDGVSLSASAQADGGWFSLTTRW